MIHKRVIERLASSVCAIERLDKTLSELQLMNHGGAGPPLVFRPQVIGTGFVVRRGWVLTNRHVIEAMLANVLTRKERTLEHWFMEWVHPNDAGGWSSTLKQIMVAAPLTSEANSSFDVGLVRYTDEARVDTFCPPVAFGRLDQVRVGADVAICGYLLGTTLLQDIPGSPRFGPVVHAGMISGVAPFRSTEARDVKALLTDLNTGKGFSGSPLFDPKSGQVFGIHHSGGIEAEFGVGLPVDKERVDGWIRLAEKGISAGKHSGSGLATGAGDLLQSPLG